MRGRSNLWAKLAARGRFRTEAKLVSDGKDYTTISAPIIVRKLMAQPMAVGSCIAATTVRVGADPGSNRKPGQDHGPDY